jgi:UDP-glucose 4-epimerase
MRSFTAVYGARGQNPAFLTEDRPLQPDSALSWVREKLEAEQHAASFARRYPELKIAVLRFAPLLGPRVHTFYTRILDRRVVPVLMGYDPLVQMLHPDDAVAAAEAAVERAVTGAFNVVPSRSIPLVTALHLAGKIPVAVPHPLAYPLVDLMWAAGIGEAPGRFCDYVRFPFVADGERARRELGFVPRYSSRDALVAYLGYRHPHARLRAAEASA